MSLPEARNVGVENTVILIGKKKMFVYGYPTLLNFMGKKKHVRVGTKKFRRKNLSEDKKTHVLAISAALDQGH